MARSCDVRKGWGRFCSQSCRARWRSGENSNRWKGGEAERRRRYVESGKSAEHKRHYYLANKTKETERLLELRHRRREQKGGRLPSGTIPSIGEAQLWRCNLCRKDIRDAYHIDHIHPLSRGGRHEAANIQLLCPPCNLRKGSKWPA